MMYYAGFEPFSIRDHNEQVLREVRKLRLETRLRDRRQPWSGRTFFFNLTRMVPLPP